MTERLTQQAYADRRGCARSAVARAVKEGRIDLVDGKIDPKRADRQWSERSKSRADSKPSSREPEKPQELAPEVSYSDARARREHLAAQQAQHNFDLARGHAINAADAQKAVFEAFRDLRDALGRLPRRLAGLVIGLSEPREVERIVDRELRNVLDAFAQPTTEALQRRMPR